MSTPTTRTTRHRIASAISEATSPTLYCPALLIAVAIANIPRHGFIALGWGAIAGLFVGVLPLAFLRIGTRRGRWDSHHVNERRRRQGPFLFTIASVAVGIALLLAGSAPRDLSALVLAMLAGLTIMMLISRLWKISVHAGTAAGGAVVLGAVMALPGALVGIVIALAAGWSRAAVRDHTAAQVLAGLVIGSATAAAVFLPLR